MSDKKPSTLFRSSLLRNVQFVKCDTRDWDQQIELFKKAKANSPFKSCDIVIANAGVSGPDEIFASSGLDGIHSERSEKAI